MATPNLINVDTITPSVAVGAVTTSRVDIVDVTAEYCAKINSLIIANIDGTNAATVTVEVSTDNGSNYPSNHSEVSTNFYDDTYRMRRTTSQSFIRIAGSVDGDDSNHDGVMSGRITIYNPSDTSNSKAIHYEMASQNQSGVAVNFRNGNGAFQNTSAVNNIKIAPNNGTIASGTFKLYGLS